MPRLLFPTVLLGFVALAAGVLHELKPSAFGKVHDLTQASFDSFIEQHDTVLVDFYAPWCHHCRLLAPKFKEAADFLGEHNIVLAKVDCTEIYLAESDSQWNNTNICHDINSYPTLRVYHGNASSYEKYGGQRRTAEDIIWFMMNGTTPVHTSPTPTRKYYPLPSKTPEPNPSPNATASNAVFLAEEKLSAIVKLEIPGLPLSEYLKDIEKSSALLLNFSISDNGKHLLLNNELLALLVPDPSRPSLIRAEKVVLDWDIGVIPKPANEKVVAIDYELWSGNRDDPGITYYNYYPKFNLNLLGAGITDFDLRRQDVDETAMHYLLDSPDQKIVEIVLHDIESRPSSSQNLSYRIEGVKLLDRTKDYASSAPRPDDRACSRWSWRCADIADPPWYRYVWHSNFDGYGRIGCMRRNVLMRWKSISVLFPNLPWPVWMVLLAGVAYIKFYMMWRQKSLGELWQGEPSEEKQAKS